METKLCIPIVGNTLKEIQQQINKAESKSDIIEIRADYLNKINRAKISEIRQLTEVPLIFTCRPEYEHGNYQGSSSKRKELLRKAVESEYDYVDVEFGSKFYKEIIQESAGNSKIILSKHNFETTPSRTELRDLKEKMENTGTDIIKLITTAESILDNFKIFKLLQKQQDREKKLISFCMGGKGEISRILAAKFGSFITFAALDEEKLSAPGQIKVDEMSRTYNISKVNKETNITGVVGKYAENSKSKYLHNPVFNQIGLNYIYLPFKVDQGQELKEFVSKVRNHDFKGLAVTIPHKEKIIEYVDKVDETGREIGAINTVSKQGGQLVGTNTDYVGAINALEKKLELRGKNCLVLGAGGAARAIVYGLVNNEVNVTIVNRTEQRAKDLGNEFSCEIDDYEKREELAPEFDIIINTTSVGMYPDQDQSILHNFPENGVAMDVVYKPLETKFIRMAKDQGCQVVTGEKMLVYQAMEQFEIWTGKRPQFETMHEAFFNIP